MKKNQGKIFEQQWKKSCPSYVLLYKLPDTPQAFGNSAFRFTKKNPFDYLMWDSKRHILFALELKSVKGSSISFERDKSSYGLIHIHQIDGLSTWGHYDGIESGFIIEFREIEKTVYIGIKEFNNLLSTLDKKSINYNDLNNNNIEYVEIPQRKIRVNYIYDVELFLSKFELKTEGEEK